MVAGPGGLGDLVHQRGNVGGRLGALAGAYAQRGQGVSGVPVQAGGVAKHQVGGFQRPGQLAFHGAQFHRVAAGLKHRQDACLGSQAAAQAVERGAQSRGVVGKVVIHGNAAHRAAQLHAALHVLKLAQRCSRHGGFHPRVVGSGNGGQGIELVVHTCQRPFHPRHLAALVQHIKGLWITLGAEVAHRCAKAAHLAPAAGVQHAGQALFQPVDHHAP